MAVILYLDDGRSFYASTIGMSGVYDLVAAQIEDRTAFSRWLGELSYRSAPFLDFDLRALNQADRVAFWTGAERAFAELKRRFGSDMLEQKNAFSAKCLHALLLERQKIDAGEHPRDSQAEIWPVDLNELWYSDEELAEQRRQEEVHRRRWFDSPQEE